jgi:Sigma-70, region 4
MSVDLSLGPTRDDGCWWMMSRLDDLPPDQRATLSLLLRQGKSYAEVASLLSIPEGAVRDRAHAALASLAGGDQPGAEASEPRAARREDISDYLLGQQTSAGARTATRAYLEDSAEGRAWAAAIAAGLAPLASQPLPEIPDGRGQRAPDRPASEIRASPAPEERAGRSRIGVPGSLPSSRLGGALLLAVIAVAAIVAIILSVGGGGSRSATTSGASASATSTSSKGAGPTEDGRFTLTPTNPASKAIGEVEILSEGDKRAFYIAADHLPPSRGFFYAIWLYNSPTSHQALSRSPPVGSNGRLEGGALLPSNAGEFHRMLLTRETNNRPSSPGPVVLSGPFSLSG